MFTHSYLLPTHNKMELNYIILYVVPPFPEPSTSRDIRINISKHFSIPLHYFIVSKMAHFIKILVLQKKGGENLSCVYM